MHKQYFKTIFLSFYSAAAYKNAFENWRGFGLQYFFIITLLTSIITSLGWAWSILKTDSKNQAETITGFILSEPDLTFEENINRFLGILHQIPHLRLEKGSLVTDIPQPYPITDPVSGYDVAIIDTSGKFKSLEGTDADLLLTKNALIIKNFDNSGKISEKVIYLRDIQQKYGIDEYNINEVLFIMKQFPSFGLRGGKFFTENNKLYTIFDSKGKLLAQIGPEAKLNNQSPEPVLVINADEISFKGPLIKNAININASHITEETMSAFFIFAVERIRKIFLITILPSIIFSSLIFGIIVLIFYSSICYTFIRIMKIGKFDFKQTTRIAAVATTPVAIIGTILPNILPSQIIIYFIITIGYLYFAVKSVTLR